MKKYSILAFAALLFVSFFMMNGCQKCDPSKDVKIGEQSITIQYFDSSGVNLLDAAATNWNLNNVKITLDKSGGKGTDLVPLLPDLANQQFGPYYYTQEFIDPATQKPNLLDLVAKTRKYDYIIDKDIYGTDVVRLEFELSGDECNTYWKTIKFYYKRHGAVRFTELDTYKGSENPVIVITD